MKKVFLILTSIIFLVLNSSFKIVQNKEFELTIIIKGIKGIKKIKGNIFIAVHNSEETFLKKRYKSKQVKVSSKIMTTTIKALKSGTYAVAVFQDENENGKLDKHFLGFPTEPYGFSNDAKGNFSAPSFEDAKFELNSNKKIILTI